MARGKPISLAMREKIIQEYRTLGKAYPKISEKIGINRATVYSIIRKYEERISQNTDIDPKCGGPRKTTINDDNSLKRLVEINPTDSFGQIKRKWEQIIKMPVSTTTCRRRLAELGIKLTPKVPPIKLTQKHHHKEGLTSQLVYGIKSPSPQKLPNAPPLQNFREPEVNIFAEEEKVTPRHIELDNNLENCVEDESSNYTNPADTSQNPQKKLKKAKNKKKLKTSSTLKATLNSLQTVTKAISVQHDEYMLFGEYIAMSLRTMPLNNALKCKEKLLSVIVNERLNQGTETSA